MSGEIVKEYMSEIRFDGLIPEEYKDDVKIYKNCHYYVLDGKDILIDDDGNILFECETVDDDDGDDTP